MKIYQLFNIPVGPATSSGRAEGAGAHAAAEEEGDAGGSPGTVGAFITPQSLVSFTGATGAISIIWATVQSFATLSPPYDKAVGLAIALLVGIFIYWMNISDPNTTLTSREKQMAFVIAVLNSLVLFVASFGAQTAIAAGAGTG